MIIETILATKLAGISLGSFIDFGIAVVILKLLYDEFTKKK